MTELDEARKKLKTVKARVVRINTARWFLEIISRQHINWHNRAKTSHVNAFMAGTFKSDAGGQDGTEGAIVWITGDGKFKLANLKNAKGCETGENVKDVLHTMMTEYADYLYFG